MIESRKRTTGTKYLLAVTLVAWIASALVGYPLLALADDPELNSFLGSLAGLFGAGIFFLSPPQLVWNFLTTIYEQSPAFQKAVEGFFSFAVKTNAILLFIILGVLYLVPFIDFVADVAHFYHDFVGSLIP